VDDANCRPDVNADDADRRPGVLALDECVLALEELVGVYRRLHETRREHQSPQRSVPSPRRLANNARREHQSPQRYGVASPRPSDQHASPLPCHQSPIAARALVQESGVDDESTGDDSLSQILLEDVDGAPGDGNYRDYYNCASDIPPAHRRVIVAALMDMGIHRPRLFQIAAMNHSAFIVGSVTVVISKTGSGKTATCCWYVAPRGGCYSCPPDRAWRTSGGGCRGFRSGD